MFWKQIIEIYNFPGTSYVFQFNKVLQNTENSIFNTNDQIRKIHLWTSSFINRQISKISSYSRVHPLLEFSSDYVKYISLFNKKAEMLKNLTNLEKKIDFLAKCSQNNQFLKSHMKVQNWNWFPINFWLFRKSDSQIQPFSHWLFRK